MPVSNQEKLENAKALLDGYARRTGLLGDEGDINIRYLWTDAFAVQGFFGLAHALEDKSYFNIAKKLIDAVHDVLGKFHIDDSREGWISGLSEEEGRERPTAGGLRIGKKLPERKPNEPFNNRLEWERDGQYFHYITRWIQALLHAEQETHEKKYTVQAAELLKASEKFLDKNGGLRMYWKMSTDLSRPLVEVSGAHDPLEGYICAESVMESLPESAKDLLSFSTDIKKLCKGQDWATTDSLGTGSLLINTLQVSGLSLAGRALITEARPQRLFKDSLYGLGYFMHSEEVQTSVSGRLAFRECGLSLGLRAMLALNGRASEVELSLEKLERYVNLADKIENFWSNPKNQQSSSWTEHLDINAVTLACSMLALNYPYAFSAVKVYS